MDWTIALSASALAVSVIIAIAGLMYLIMRLMVQPLREDIDEIKQNTSKIKSDDEIENLIELKIAKHKEECSKTIHRLINKTIGG